MERKDRSGKNDVSSYAHRSEKKPKKALNFRMRRLLLTVIIAVVALVALCASLLALAVAAVTVVDSVIIPSIKYSIALDAIEDRDYDKAYRLFYSLGDHKDSEEYLARFEIDCEKQTVISTDWSGSVTESASLLQVGEAISAEGGFYSSYVYDENGIFIRAEHRSDNGDLYVSEYAYDKDGRLISEIHTDSDGMSRTHRYSYDGQGRIQYRMQENGYLRLEQYYENGITVRDTQSYSDNELYTFVEGIYENGMLVCLRCTKTNGSVEIFEDEYEDGRLIRDVVDYDGLLETVIYELYEYDAKGNAVRKTDRTGAVYEYEYDEKGNCIRTITPINEIIYEYSEDGKLISEDIGAGVCKYSYDRSGSLRSTTFTDEDGKVTHKFYDHDREELLFLSYSKGFFRLGIGDFDLTALVTKDRIRFSYGDSTDTLELSMSIDEGVAGLSVNQGANGSVRFNLSAYFYRLTPVYFRFELGDVNSYGFGIRSAIFEYNGLEYPSFWVKDTEYDEIRVRYVI